MSTANKIKARGRVDKKKRVDKKSPWLGKKVECGHILESGTKQNGSHKQDAQKMYSMHHTTDGIRPR